MRRELSVISGEGEVPFMEIDRAVEIVSALADGVNPATGEVFPSDSPYQQPEVIRALFTVIQALRRKAERLERRRSLPAKTGQAWTAADEEELLRLFEAGAQISEIAGRLGRTAGGITARLVKLGKIEPPAGMALLPARGGGD